MAITWELQDPLPGQLFASFAAAVSWTVTAYEGDRSTLVEVGAGREGVVEDLGIDLVRHAGGQLGLASSRRRPRPQSRTVSQPIGGTQGHRSPLCISFRQLELGIGDESEGHGEGAVLGVPACVHRIHQQRSSLAEVTSPHGK